MLSIFSLMELWWKNTSRGHGVVYIMQRQRLKLVYFEYMCMYMTWNFQAGRNRKEIEDVVGYYGLCSVHVYK